MKQCQARKVTVPDKLCVYGGSGYLTIIDVVKQIRSEEAERFEKLFSMTNDFDASIFAGEVIDDDDDDVDTGVQDHGRKLLQAASILDDQNALLQFKQGISLDPNGTLQGWNTSANQDHCAWTGVICSNITNRVIGLKLTGSTISALTS